MIRLLILSLAALLFLADPAAADPISGLIAAGKAFFATKLGAIVAQVAISSGLSLIAQRLRKKPKQPGLQNQFKGRGGTEPGSFVLGRAAVKGHQTYHNSQGDNSKWYHEVIELCDLPGATLERLIIDGEYSAIGDVYVDGSAGDVGNIIVAKNKDSDSHRAFIRTYDGTQTAADALLVSHFAEDDRRWTTDHKLTGICYAVLSYYFDRKRFSRGVPELSFEMLGIPVYDPRKDTSVGGSGAHRWADPSTWEQSENLIVLVYNILRGIAAPGGAVWGGDCEHEDLPMANWVAAMNACDVDLGGRKKYTGGIEVKWTDAPADIIEQLLAGCNGQITELGGVYRVQVDAPATAVVSVTDDDFIVSDPSEMDPFPGLEGTFNGGTVVHPDPAQLWNASQPHTVTNPSLETQDGTQRLFDLQLPVVHNTAQAKQVLNAAVNDGRRFRRHKGTLPPDLFWLDTLSTFAWTSESEGYTAKLFEISETAYDLLTFNTVRSIRERDPSDFLIVPGLELPGLPSAITPPARPDAGVPGFDIVPVTVDDGNGNRRITFKLIWTAAALEGTVDGVAYQLRLSSTEETVLTGDIADVSEGQAFLPGSYIPGASYDARAKAISRVRDTDWTGWVTESAPAVSDNLRLVQLTTGVPVFTYTAAGDTPAPASTVFTATARGTIGTPYFEFFVDDVSQGAPSTTATFTYTPRASAANMPDVVRVELRDGGASEDVVASDRITVIGLVPGERGVSMLLTNEAHTVPAAADGTGEDLAGAFTDVQVFIGTQLDTGNWTLSRTNSTGVGSTLVGNRVTVTDLDVNAGYVDITASRAGFTSMTRRFTLTKTRRGDNGSNGISTYLATIFRRSASAPATPTGGSYDFETQTITTPSGWSDEVPDGSLPVYVSFALASILGTTGSDDTLTWSAPSVLARDGVDGNLVQNSQLAGGDSTLWTLGSGQEDQGGEDETFAVTVVERDTASSLTGLANAPTPGMFRIQFGTPTGNINTESYNPQEDSTNRALPDTVFDEAVLVQYDDLIPAPASGKAAVSVYMCEEIQHGSWTGAGAMSFLARVTSYDKDETLITTTIDQHAALMSGANQTPGVWYRKEATFDLPANCAFYKVEFTLLQSASRVCYLAKPWVEPAIYTTSIGRNEVTETEYDSASTVTLAANNTFETLCEVDVEVPDIPLGNGSETMRIEAQGSGNFQISNSAIANIDIVLQEAGQADVILNSLQSFGTEGYSLSGYANKGPGTYTLLLRGKATNVSDVTFRRNEFKGVVLKR